MKIYLRKIDEVYSHYNIEIPKIYDHVTRTGCMGCPYGSYKGNTQKEIRLANKNQYKFLWKYFGESYRVLGIEDIRDKICIGSAKKRY